MSQISLKSISGITSITTPAGVDDVFSIYTNNLTEVFRIDQSGNQNISGIITATQFKGDGSQLSGISVGITTEAITPSGITTHLLLNSADDHKVLATGTVTIDVTGGTEADSHQIRIENVGVATVGFSTAFLFPSGGTPNLPITIGAKSLVSFTIHKVGAAGTELFAGVSQNFS